jgi:hypothetical protein
VPWIKTIPYEQASGILKEEYDAAAWFGAAC